MKSIFKSLLGPSAVLVLSTTGSMAANQPGAVVQVPSVDYLSHHDYTATPQFSLSGYYATGDGGEGVFVKDTCTPDGGSCLADSAGNHYSRLGFNGNVAQFGLIAGSSYDWSVHHTSSTDASPVLSTIQAVGLTKGISTTHCNSMKLFLATDFSIASHSSFTCDVNPGITTDDSEGYTNLPGSLFLDHGVTINRAGDSTSFYGAYVLPYWYTSAPTTAQTGFALLANMVSNGDTAVLCDQKACIDYDLTIQGFDTGYEAFQSPNSIWDNINVDADVCFWIQKVGGNTNNQNFNCSPNLTRTVPAGKKNQFFDITKIENDGGLCKVTVTPHSAGSDDASDIQFANYMFLTRLTNSAASCNGQWKISNYSGTSSSASFDLVGSAVVGPSVYTHWAANTQIVYTANNTNIQPGNTITGFAAQGIPDGTSVLYVWNLPEHPSGYVTSTGSANAYLVDEGSFAPCHLADSLNVYWSPNFTNTAAATLNIALNIACGGGSSGAVPILRADGSALQANDIVSGAKLFVKLNSDSTAWLLQQPKLVLSVKTGLAQVTPVNIHYLSAICTVCGMNARAEFTAAARIDAGASEGGVVAGGLQHATGIMVGGPAAKGFDDTDKVAGFTCTDCTVFDHSIFGHVQNSNNTKFQDWRTDSEGSTDNPNQILMMVDGQSNSMQLSGVKSAKGGIGLLVNIAYPNNPDKACATWTGASIASSTGTFPVFDIEQGCGLMTAAQSSGSGVNFIANLAEKAGFSNVYMPNSTNIYEGDAARAVTWTTGSSFSGGLNSVDFISSGVPAVTSSSLTQITPTAVFWPCDATSNNVPLQLPDATILQNYNFQVYRKDVATSGFGCHITTQSGQTIGGHADWWLTSRNARLSINSDGTVTWVIQ